MNLPPFYPLVANFSDRHFCSGKDLPGLVYLYSLDSTQYFPPSIQKRVETPSAVPVDDLGDLSDHDRGKKVINKVIIKLPTASTGLNSSRSSSLRPPLAPRSRPPRPWPSRGQPPPSLTFQRPVAASPVSNRPATASLGPSEAGRRVPGPPAAGRRLSRPRLPRPTRDRPFYPPALRDQLRHPQALRVHPPTGPRRPAEAIPSLQKLPMAISATCRAMRQPPTRTSTPGQTGSSARSRN